MKRGNLEETPAIALVRDMMNAGESGLVKLESGTTRATAYLRDGRVVFAATNIKALRPSTWLEAAGFGDAAELDAIKARERGSMEQINAWVEAGIGNREALVTTYRRCLRAAALEMLTWTEGSWSFKPGSPVLTHEVSLDEPTRNLLLQAAANVPKEIGDDIRESLSADETDSTTADLPAVATAAGEEDSAAAAKGTSSATTAGEMTSPPVDTPVVNTGSSGKPTHGAVNDPLVRETLQRSRSALGQTLYELLELTDAASEDGIRAAYYGLARRFHPDTLHGEEADRHRQEIESYFAAVTEAYNRLRNADERRAYDEELRAGQRQHKPAATDTTALARENYDQGRRALANDRLHDASQFLANAVRLDDTKPEYHRELGIVQMKNPRWQKQAEESLQQAIKLQPADARALIHLGRLYKSNGLKRRADEMFQKALEWDPENTAALRALASEDGESGDGGGLFKGLLRRS